MGEMELYDMGFVEMGSSSDYDGILQMIPHFMENGHYKALWILDGGYPGTEDNYRILLLDNLHE